MACEDQFDQIDQLIVFSRIRMISSGNSSIAAAVRSRFRFDKQREVNLA
jgi:hypothetical protein